jgi:hypothetical protein
MVDANYYDLPEYMKRRNKMAELERKAGGAPPVEGRQLFFFFSGSGN